LFGEDEFTFHYLLLKYETSNSSEKWIFKVPELKNARIIFILRLVDFLSALLGRYWWGFKLNIFDLPDEFYVF